MLKPTLVLALLSLSTCESLRAQETKETWMVAGEQREAWIFPARQRAEGSLAPVVFAFHGHGGTARSAAKNFRIHDLWPEAVVVYPQGLPTKTRRDPQGQRPGWQPRAGDYGDRDLQFVDDLWRSIKEKHHGDPRRVFAIGHSNGGGFTYLLWLKRAELFAAFAPSAAGGMPVSPPADLPPRPVLHIAGKRDPIVEFARQQSTIDAVKKWNGCEEPGQPWATGCTFYPSTKNAPVVTFIHDGDHQYPAAAPTWIVKFFREVGSPQP